MCFLKMALTCWIHFCFIAFLFPSTTLATMCYVCGQTNLKPPGECTTQFQYDCSTINGASQRGSKSFCRTTRSKIGENVFSVGKECTTEHDHLTRYPHGKISGCDTLDKNGSHELSYCVCDRNFCNMKNIDDQISDHQNQQQQRPSIITNPLVVGLPDVINASITASPEAGAQIQRELGTVSQHLPSVTQGQPLPDPPEFLNNITNVDSSELEITSVSHVSSNHRTVETMTVNSKQIQIQPSGIIFPSSASSNSSTVDKRLSTNSSILQVQTVETHHLILTENESTKNEEHEIDESYFCSTCAESNVSTTIDCSEQINVDCRKMFPGDENLFCFTKGTILQSGQYVVEKRCASRGSLLQDFGIIDVTDGCNEKANSSAVFQYCTCSTSRCNNISLTEHIKVKPIRKLQEKPHEFQNKPLSNLTTQLACFTCSESNLAQGVDCSLQYEKGCMSSDSSKMLCLSRQTKLSSGLFSIEKRCISELEHQQQYQGSEVVLYGLYGCGVTLNGQEQYCICENNFCNKQNIVNQKENPSDKNQNVSQSTIVLHTLSEHGRSYDKDENTKSPPKPLKKNDLTISNVDYSKKLSNKQMSNKDSSSSPKLFRFQSILTVVSFLILLIMFEQ